MCRYYRYWTVFRETNLCQITVGALRILVLRKGFPIDKVVVSGVTLSLALLAWQVVTVAPMVPITGVIDSLALSLFVAVWAVGMVAMMLPSALPMVFAVVAATRTMPGGVNQQRVLRRSLQPMQFILGYFGIWSAVGVAAYLALVFLFRFYPPFSSLGQLAGISAGVSVFLAGVYQLSPLKQKALQACRSPMSFIMTSWRSGKFGRFLMGTDYGFFCTKCCWAFMAVLLVVGAMNLLWMVLFAAAIFVEKVAPYGAAVSKIIGVALMAAGSILALTSYLIV